MAATVTAAWDNARLVDGNDAEIELMFIVDGESDELLALTDLQNSSNVPTTFGGLFRDSEEIERLTDDTWRGTVRYTPLGEEDTNSSVYRFDTTGGQEHITQSFATTSYAPPSKTAPDFKGAIGVTDDAVEGVDIVVPKYGFSETHFFLDAQVTQGYRLTVAGITGHVNALTFRGFTPFEVLFLGATGSRSSDKTGIWEITFNFSANPNTVVTIGDITGVAKNGYDYLWVKYERQEDGTAGEVKRPRAAYVEETYTALSFAGLGI